MISPIHKKVLAYWGARKEGFEEHWNLGVYHSGGASTPIYNKELGGGQRGKWGEENVTYDCGVGLEVGNQK